MSGLGQSCNSNVGGGMLSAIRVHIDNHRHVEDLRITSPGGVPTITFAASPAGLSTSPVVRTLGAGNDLATLADVVGFLDEHATDFAGIFAELRPPYTGGVDAALLAEHDYVSGASIEGPAFIEIAGHISCVPDPNDGPIKPAIYSLVTGSAALLARIGTNCYAGLAPQSIGNIEHIVYQVISSPRQHTFNGPEGLVIRRVQFNCYAPTRIAADSLADTLRLEIDGFRGPAGPEGNQVDIHAIILVDERDDLDPAPGSEPRRTFVNQMDFEIAHRERTPVLAV